MDASYAISVRQASALPAASFRFHLAMDTLAVRLAVPLIGPAKVFHLLGLRPAGRTKKTDNEFVAGFTIRSLLPVVTTLSSQFIASTLSGPRTRIYSDGSRKHAITHTSEFSCVAGGLCPFVRSCPLIVTVMYDSDRDKMS